jgi:ferric-dicitrate binding protein FerR (iron transport regulator)
VPLSRRAARARLGGVDGAVASFALAPRTGGVLVRCDGDLRPGGGWRYRWQREDGSELSLDGE